MNLSQLLPQHNHVLAIAERVKQKYPSCDGQCEVMSIELVKQLKAAGIQANHVMGNFHLDEPAPEELQNPEDEDSDDYVVVHDWVTVEGKILDLSAEQFKNYVHDRIPEIVYISYSDPLYIHYEELGHV